MDDEDKWFFESIKRYVWYFVNLLPESISFQGSFFHRYNQLQMFDFDKSAQDLDLSSENNLCVALQPDHNNKCEILVCSLPSTLKLKDGSGDLKFDRNLSFTHGYFTNSPVVQVRICTYSLIIIAVNQLHHFGIICR